MEHLGVFKNLKRVRAFQIELEFGTVVFKGDWNNWSPRRKPLRARERTNNKLNPHIKLTPGFEPGPHWWQGSAISIAPCTLAPQNSIQTSHKLFFSFIIFGLKCH